MHCNHCLLEPGCMNLAQLGPRRFTACTSEAPVHRLASRSSSSVRAPALRTGSPYHHPRFVQPGVATEDLRGVLQDHVSPCCLSSLGVLCNYCLVGSSDSRALRLCMLGHASRVASVCRLCAAPAKVRRHGDRSTFLAISTPSRFSLVHASYSEICSEVRPAQRADSKAMSRCMNPALGQQICAARRTHAHRRRNVDARCRANRPGPRDAQPPPTLAVTSLDACIGKGARAATGQQDRRRPTS